MFLWQYAQEAAIKRDQTAFVVNRERKKIGVGNLTVSHESGVKQDHGIVEAQIGRPKLMPRQS